MFWPAEWLERLKMDEMINALARCAVKSGKRLLRSFDIAEILKAAITLKATVYVKLFIHKKCMSTSDYDCNKKTKT